MAPGPLIGVSPGFHDYGDYLGIAFTRILERRGALALIVPHPERPGELAARLDGLLLCGGRDIEPSRYGAVPHPRATAHASLRDATELPLGRAAIDCGVPVLAICRGMQVINVVYGGTLHPDHSELPPPADRHPGGDWERWRRVVAARLAGEEPPEHPAHEITTEPGSVLESLLGSRATVNSYHHQSIATVGDGLSVSARAADGVAEALERPGAPAFCLGVQWELQEEPDSPLWDAFVSAANARAAERPPAQPQRLSV